MVVMKCTVQPRVIQSLIGLGVRQPLECGFLQERGGGQAQEAPSVP